jgi:tRNA(Ile)-lysidine synthase
VVASALVVRVAETILRYNMLPHGHRVGVAVSGGADSIFLLMVLHELAQERGWSLTVLHLNHALRADESDLDEAFVRETAARLGLPCVIERAVDLRGPNLEEKAREARYAFFVRAVAGNSLDCAASAHTVDDQAETFLIRLLRGAAATGLAGIAPVAPEGGIVRPLLEIERPEIEAWLRERNIAWREDASNRDPAFTRNRVRHELLPLLERDWNPGIRRLLAGTADVLATEEEYWRRWADAELSSIARPFGGGNGLILGLDRLASLHPAPLRRLLRRTVERVKGDLRRVDRHHIYKIEQLCRSSLGKGSVTLPGLVALRSFDRILFVKRQAGSTVFAIDVVSPGAVEVPGGSTLHFRVALPPVRTGYTKRAGDCPDVIDPPVVVRSWRPGDAYQPTGYTRRRKLKELFYEGQVPSWERTFWPIVESDGQIVWARRFGFAVGVALNWTCEDEMQAG